MKNSVKISDKTDIYKFNIKTALDKLTKYFVFKSSEKCDTNANNQPLLKLFEWRNLMRKPLIILFFLFSFFICLATIAQTPLNDEEGVTDVILDRTEAVTLCPGQLRKSGICNGDELKIKIKTVAKDAEKKGLDFYYLVSGGKIIGRGANVVWDFTDANPGYYLIAVGVGRNGVIQGKLITKTIPLYECPQCYIPCECPSISVSGPTTPAKRGDSITFTLYVSGGTQNSVSYNWTVSSGKIVSGQGTNRIIVKTDKVKKVKIVTATVEVGGLCEGCPMRESASVELKDK